MKFLYDLPSAKDKRAVIRADFDVPIQENRIADETRIETNLPTIRFLLSKGFSLVLLAHLDRPTNREEKFSLKPVAKVLEYKLGRQINFLDQLPVKTFKHLNLLENLRFWPGEEENDINFARLLADLGDFYINDAFAVCHRTHASVVGVPKLLPSFAGFHLAQEVKELSAVLEKPKRPLVAIIGGAKIETKKPAILNLAKVADKVLVGGKLMFEIAERDLPPNVFRAPDDIEGKDIGPRSVTAFSKAISEASMVVWNGPLGLFEEEKYAIGTKAVATALVNSKAYSIVGGGDTISALNKLGILGKIDYVSTGGGAMLEFLAGKKLPGLEALEGR